jgi:hypothetical protein
MTLVHSLMAPGLPDHPIYQFYRKPKSQYLLPIQWNYGKKMVLVDSDEEMDGVVWEYGPKDFSESGSDSESMRIVTPKSRKRIQNKVVSAPTTPTTST